MSPTLPEEVGMWGSAFSFVFFFFFLRERKSQTLLKLQPAVAAALAGVQHLEPRAGAAGPGGCWVGVRPKAWGLLSLSLVGC